MRIMEIHAPSLNQHKGIKMDTPLGCYRVIQLPDRAAAKVSRIFVFCIHILNSFIDALKFRIGNDSLAPQNQPPRIGNLQRKIAKDSCIIGDYLTHQTVSSGNRFDQLPSFIGQDNGQPIQFPG